MNTLTILLTEEQLESLADRIAKKIDPQQKKPLTVAEASRALGIAQSTITLHVRAGVIKKVPDCGKQVLIPRTEIERLQKGVTR
jgi:excisionase family DNA binding protein